MVNCYRFAGSERIGRQVAMVNTKYSYESVESTDGDEAVINKPFLEANDSPDTPILPPNDEPITDYNFDPDNEVLISLGYRQEFKRGFTVWSIFCLSFSSLGLLPSVAATLYYTLG